MNKAEFMHKLSQSTTPVVAYFWAPWCGPCRAMAPALKQVTEKYAGQVELIKINADEHPDLVRELGVLGIPTLIGYRHGRLVLRRTGAQPLESLDIFFGAVLTGDGAVTLPISPLNRILRLGSSAVLAAAGLLSGPSWVLLAVSGLLLFSAVYDRCPLYRALAPRVQAWFRRS